MAYSIVWFEVSSVPSEEPRATNTTCLTLEVRKSLSKKIHPVFDNHVLDRFMYTRQCLLKNGWMIYSKGQESATERVAPVSGLLFCSVEFTPLQLSLN
jgi:hypothetical protein